MVDNPVAALVLGFIKGHIGAFHNALVIRMSIAGSNADADRDFEALLVGDQEIGFFDASPELFGNGSCLVVVNLGQDDEKLFATITEDEVASPCFVEQLGRDLLEDLS